MLTAAGGTERCRIKTWATCLATFVDTATGEPRVACDFVEADHAPTALQQDHSLGALLFLCAAPRDRREATVARINDGSKPSKNALISCACDVWRLQHFHLLMASFTSNTPQRQAALSQRSRCDSARQACTATPVPCFARKKTRKAKLELCMRPGTACCTQNEARKQQW